MDKGHLPKVLEDGYVKKALGVLEMMNFTEAARNAYDEQLKWLMIEASAIEK